MRGSILLSHYEGERQCLSGDSFLLFVFSHMHAVLCDNNRGTKELSTVHNIQSDTTTFSKWGRPFAVPLPLSLRLWWPWLLIRLALGVMFVRLGIRGPICSALAVSCASVLPFGPGRDVSYACGYGVLLSVLLPISPYISGY